MKTGIVTGLTLILGVALCVIFLGPGHLESADSNWSSLPNICTRSRPCWMTLSGSRCSRSKSTVRGRGSFAEEEVMVTMKAAYTDDSLYFLFKWKDATKSVTKGAWKFDGREMDPLKRRRGQDCSSL